LSAGLRHPYIRIIPSGRDHPGLPGLKDYRKTIEALRNRWPEARTAVGSLLMDPGIKGNIYGIVGKGRPSPRKLKVDAIVAAMDQFLAMERPFFPPIPDIEKLSADKLAASMRKGYPPPVHQIFASCARLWQQKNLLTEELEKKLTFLKRDLFNYILKERAERKGKRNVRGYQDLLMESFSALKQKGSDRVLAAVRSRYRAALIDEFQDTDPIQFHIFDGIFGKGNVPLYYIGDPKQAIYGFRGADVVTYMEAARAVPETATLRMNWRSEPNLVQAVNELFSGIDRPFVYPEIGYTPSAAAEERKPRPLRMTGGAGAPLRMCLLHHPPGQDPSVPLAKKKAWPSILKFVAREAARLVDLGRSRKALLGDEPLSERHMAVLVRKNSEARMVQECLREVKIPSVLYNAGNIFETVEAREIGVILQAIAEPRNEDHMRAALTTDTMGVEGAEMERLSLQESGWEHRMLDFREYHRIWEEQGFIPLFRRLLAREKARQRLLAFSDGERRLTNILHLGELLHGAALEERLGMKGLVTWLFRRIEDRLNGGDEQLLKLETDEEAVKIVTIHKSKGLEYPVVFCPSLWDGGQRRGEDIIYHDPDHDRQLTLDLGSEGRKSHERVAGDEVLSENLR
ncbi:MAG: UvrD-helicase domain-containing protein, partial [Deltaproteobacteria bacterium]